MLDALLASAALLLTSNDDPSEFSAGEALIEQIDEEAVLRMQACGIDEAELERLINLSQDAFDQDFSGGWRPYGNQQGCELAAADLILTYLAQSPHVEDRGILQWHAGQMLAAAGAYDRAIDLLVASSDDEPSAWNVYVEGTVAFLREDREGLEAAREALLEYAPSEEEQAATRRFLEENPNIQVPDGFVTDPPNLPVIDRFLACWGEPYAVAYAGECAALQPEIREAVEARVTEPACMLVGQRLQAFYEEAGPDVRSAISANWLSSPGDRTALVALLNQDGRASGPDAPFAMGYQPDFAEAIAGLTESDMDQIHANLTTPGPIDCGGANLSAEPFTDDLSGFLSWAEDQSLNPDPEAPAGAQTLALSRPTVFDGGARALVVESYSYTPIPLSRPPSAHVIGVIYERGPQSWVQEASIFVARSG